MEPNFGDVEWKEGRKELPYIDFFTEDDNICPDPFNAPVKWSWDNPAALAKVSFVYKPKRAVKEAAVQIVSEEALKLIPIETPANASLVERAAQKVVCEDAPRVAAMASHMGLDVVAVGLEEEAEATMRMAALLSPREDVVVPVREHREMSLSARVPELGHQERATLALAYLKSSNEDDVSDANMPHLENAWDPEDIILRAFSSCATNDQCECCDVVEAHIIAKHYSSDNIRSVLFPREYPIYLTRFTLVEFLLEYPEFSLDTTNPAHPHLMSPYFVLDLSPKYEPLNEQLVDQCMKQWLGPFFNFIPISDRSMRVFSAVTYDRVVIARKGKLVMGSDRVSIAWAPVERRAAYLEAAAEIRDIMNQQLALFPYDYSLSFMRFAASCQAYAWKRVEHICAPLVNLIAKGLEDVREPLAHTTLVDRYTTTMSTIRHPQTPEQAFSLVEALSAAASQDDYAPIAASPTPFSLNHHARAMHTLLSGNPLQYYRLRNIDNGYGALPPNLVLQKEIERAELKCKLYFRMSKFLYLCDTDDQVRALGGRLYIDTRYQSPPLDAQECVIDLRDPILDTSEEYCAWVSNHVRYLRSCFRFPVTRYSVHEFSEYAFLIENAGSYMMFDSLRPLSHSMFCCVNACRQGYPAATSYIKDQVSQRCAFVLACIRAILVAVVGGDRLDTLPSWKASPTTRVAPHPHGDPYHPDANKHTRATFTAAQYLDTQLTDNLKAWAFLGPPSPITPAPTLLTNQFRRDDLEVERLPQEAFLASARSDVE